MARRFNPPPNWPPPPDGWTPPPGWQPDPSWGPPPDGWPLWQTYRPNRDAWKWSLLSGVGLSILFVAVGSALARTAPPAEVAGAITGRLLFAALVVWLIAFLSSGRWPRWTYPLAVFGVGLVLSALSVAGQAGST